MSIGGCIGSRFSARPSDHRCRKLTIAWASIMGVGGANDAPRRVTDEFDLMVHFYGVCLGRNHHLWLPGVEGHVMKESTCSDSFILALVEVDLSLAQL